MLAYDWDQLFKTGIAASNQQQRDPEQDPSGASQRMYIIKPIDGQLHYLRRGKNVRQGESEAIQEAGFDLQSIAFNVSSEATYSAGIRHVTSHGPCGCRLTTLCLLDVKADMLALYLDLLFALPFLGC